jgi:phosphatidylserine/phosphatidylglycerophosphate/cardiolipin synthase-like enzyme
MAIGILIWGNLICLGISCLAHADVHLIQSIPEETSLGEPDIAFTQSEWIDMFKNAKSTIDIAQFYISAKPYVAGRAAADDPLEPVIRELEKAGARGVKIRVLVSPNLVSQDQTSFERIRTIPNTEIHLLDLSKKTHGILHAKYFVVDSRDMFVGSQNFDWRALSEIHETGVRLSDEAVAAELERIFDLDWGTKRSSTPFGSKAKRYGGPFGGPFGPSGVELLASPPKLLPRGIKPALPALIQLIGSAKSSLHIQVMSYTLTDKFGPAKEQPPKKWTEIDDAIREAAGRGVQVQMMISDWGIGAPAVDELKSLQKVPGVEIRIVSIPEASTGHIPFARVTHSKYMVIDDQSLWLGTSNWEKNYFYGSRNIELILRVPRLAIQGERIFAKLWNSPYAKKLDLTKAYVARKQQ